jgi:SAM-dependent MidA family methyltransferase
MSSPLPPPQLAARPPSNLPEPESEALSRSAALCRRLLALIDAAGGFLPFERYMQEALFAPGLGYYSGPSAKFGSAGDFVTAPEMSPLFGKALARQVQQIMAHSSAEVLELGAGSGRLALDMLLALKAAGVQLPRYRILDVSGDLRARQQQLFMQRAPELMQQVEWLDSLPSDLSGAVIGNEVLDALACEIYELDQAGWFQIGVCQQHGQLIEGRRPIEGALPSHLQAIASELTPEALPYRLEVTPAAGALVSTIAERLSQGAALFLDYGFPAHEFYHPQRVMGTLVAHYRHHVHSDVLLWPGLQDLTAHVDFTAMAHSADDAGATLYGYTSQARFLLNCGVLELMADASSDALTRLKATPGLQRLVSEAEMGELFKVFAFGRGIDEPLLGFINGDRLARL